MLTDIEMVPLRDALRRSRAEIGYERWDVADVIEVVGQYLDVNPDVQAVPPLVLCSDADHHHDKEVIERQAAILDNVRQGFLEVKRIVDSSPNLAAHKAALDALRELVRLHRLKEDMDMRQTYGPMDEPGQPTWAQKQQDYSSHKPQAWAKAYAAVDAIDLP